jgi:hypothetical protein
VKFKICTAFFLAVIFPSAPAFAAPDDACNYGTSEAWQQVNGTIVGSWQITHHAGYYIAGPMAMPFPASGDVETMQIEMTADGRLIGTHPEAPAPIEFIWADEPPWSFEAHAKADGTPAPLLSSTDVESMMGCKVEDLARLIGHSQVTMEGVTMDMTLRLMILGATSIYGIFHTSSIANGVSVKSWRAVTMTR